MSNYPVKNYGDAAAGAGGGGGGGTAPGAYRSNTGSNILQLVMDVANYAAGVGAQPVNMQYIPADVVKALPPDADFGAGTVAVESIAFVKTGTGVPPPDASYVPIADLTQPSLTVADPCPDVGTVICDLLVAWSDGSWAKLGTVQVIVEDNQTLCGGP